MSALQTKSLLVFQTAVHIYIYIYIYTHTDTRCYNLIPGIVAACRCGVESGKLVYSSTFGHVTTCVYMSHRTNESFVPEQQRK